MTLRLTAHSNPLGDLKAESDRLLDSTFLETQEYRWLLATSDRFIVVGRRGTGKSALFLSLSKYYSPDPKTCLLRWSPEEEQVMGLRPLFAKFGPSFTAIRAACKIAAECAVLHEFLSLLSRHYKFQKYERADEIRERLRLWNASGLDPTERLRTTLALTLPAEDSLEAFVARLGTLLGLSELREWFHAAASLTDMQCVLLLDRLDEGYLPDAVGTAIVDGLIHAASGLKSRYAFLKPVLFIRDNIFRAVERDDPDFSRTIENQFYRLHWDDRLLLQMVARRLRVAFDLAIDNDQRAWSHCVGPALQGDEGFRRCLRLTLYRPRDLIALLNDSFYEAGRLERPSVDESDVEATARRISSARLEDLIKEYSHTILGLRTMATAFSGVEPSMSVATAFALAQAARSQIPSDPLIQSEFAIFGDPDSQIRLLYSIGFLGVKDTLTGRYVFCHDGRSPDRAFSDADLVMIHPCYWMALNVPRTPLDRDVADEIFDEYQIDVSSDATEIRRANLGRLMARLDGIACGDDATREFEEWCLHALRILFASDIHNIEVRASADGDARRQIVGQRASTTGSLAQALVAHGSGPVLFYLHNDESITPDLYQRAAKSLGESEARLGFLICRAHDENIRAEDGMLETLKKVRASTGRVMVLLTARSLRNLLSKLRSPQMRAVTEPFMRKLLERYLSMYLAGK